MTVFTAKPSHTCSIMATIKLATTANRHIRDAPGINASDNPLPLFYRLQIIYPKLGEKLT